MKTPEQIPNVDVPEGQSGPWRIERFTITAEDVKLENLRASFRPGARMLYPGTYTRLMRGGEVVMSDTHAEKSDHWAPVHHAKGEILLNGLGLGMVLNACLLKPEVTFCTVVEKDMNVIALTAAHWKEKFGARLRIHHGDALNFKDYTVTRYGMVWHDIWDNICSDNLPEMTKLHRRYGRKTDWQGSWAKELCRR